MRANAGPAANEEEPTMQNPPAEIRHQPSDPRQVAEKPAVPFVPEWRRRSLEAAAKAGRSPFLATAAISGGPRL
jgi:hypothetical protein